jgi:hypothetical protein
MPVQLAHSARLDFDEREVTSERIRDKIAASNRYS